MNLSNVIRFLVFLLLASNANAAPRAIYEHTCQAVAGQPKIRSLTGSGEMIYYICSAGTVLYADDDLTATSEMFSRLTQAGALKNDEIKICRRWVAERTRCGVDAMLQRNGAYQSGRAGECYRQVLKEIPCGVR